MPPYLMPLYMMMGSISCIRLDRITSRNVSTNDTVVVSATDTCHALHWQELRPLTDDRRLQ